MIIKITVQNGSDSMQYTLDWWDITTKFEILKKRKGEEGDRVGNSVWYYDKNMQKTYRKRSIFKIMIAKLLSHYNTNPKSIRWRKEKGRPNQTIIGWRSRDKSLPLKQVVTTSSATVVIKFWPVSHHVVLGIPSPAAIVPTPIHPL